ncbi:MAG: serine/threonine-protein kinase, partial [Candidatus Eremiobacterota bacterium]
MSELERGMIIKSYTIIRPLGKGGMAQVYLGSKNSRYYAIKEVSEFSSSEQEEVAIKSFEKEADILSDTRHPGLPVYYETFMYGNKIYLVMEYIEGNSMEELINSSPVPIDIKRSVTWTIHLCEILFYLHNLSPEPVIYRDMKPANVIITHDGRARLVDFGIARRYDPLKHADTFRLGTPGYAAPEQFKKDSQTTPCADIYALGVLLYQTITKYDPTITPFKFPTLRSLNPSIPAKLEYILQKAMHLDCARRYRDIDEFKDDLIRFYEENYEPFMSPYDVESISYKKSSVTRPIKPSQAIPDYSSRQSDTSLKNYSAPAPVDPNYRIPLSVTPRAVTPGLYIKILTDGYVSLAIFLLNIALIMSFFSNYKSLREARYFKGDLVSTQAVITGTKGYDYSSTIMVHYTFEYSYTYYGPDNKLYHGVSYSPFFNCYKINDNVPVEYTRKDPSLSRLSPAKSGYITYTFTTYNTNEGTCRIYYILYIAAAVLIFFNIK